MRWILVKMEVGWLNSLYLLVVLPLLLQIDSLLSLLSSMPGGADLNGPRPLPALPYGNPPPEDTAGDGRVGRRVLGIFLPFIPALTQHPGQ